MTLIGPERTQRRDQFLGRIGSRQAVTDDIIEPAEKGRIKHTGQVVGLRDRAIIGILVYAAARVDTSSHSRLLKKLRPAVAG